MQKEFTYAKDLEEASRIHTEWWFSLSPYEKFRSNIEHVKIVAKSKPELFKLPNDRYILK